MFVSSRSSTPPIVLASAVILLAGSARGETHEISIDAVSGVMTPASLEIAEGDVIRFVLEDVPNIVFEDDFSTNLGWLTTATSETGLWVRRIPYTECSEDRQQVNRSADLDPWCMMTGGSWASCEDDVDLGNVILISPPIQLPAEPVWISFAQWFGNSGGFNPYQNPMVVEAVIGTNTYELSRYDTDPRETEGGWRRRNIPLADFASWSAGEQMTLRITCEEVINAVVEGGFDDLMVRTEASSSVEIRTVSGCKPNGLFTDDLLSDTGFLTWSADDLGGLSEFKIQYDGDCKGAVSVTVVNREPLLVGGGGFATIQAAVDKSSDGDTIQVVGGIRTERVHLRDRKIVLEPVPGTGKVTLQGDGNPGSLMWIGEGQGSETVVRGFRFVGGIGDNPDPDGPPNGWATSAGGLNLWGTSPLIEDCDFENNRASYSPAINLQGSGSIIRDCTFTGNATAGTTSWNYPVYCGGAITMFSYRDNSSTGGLAVAPVIENCTFQSNAAVVDGGAIMVWYASPQIRDCLFEDNRASGSGGGAVAYASLTDFTTPDDPLLGWHYIERCTFRNNAADGIVTPDPVVEGGGGAFAMFQNANDADDPTLGVRFIDCVFENNSSNFHGGAMWIQDTRVELENVRMSGNDSSGYTGGAAYTKPNTSLTLQRSEICDNSPDDFGGSGDLITDPLSIVCSEGIIAGDITGDGIVDAADLGLLIAGWGPCAPVCPGDLTGDGKVDAADLGLLISLWSF